MPQFSGKRNDLILPLCNPIGCGNAMVTDFPKSTGNLAKTSFQFDIPWHLLLGLFFCIIFHPSFSEAVIPGLTEQEKAWLKEHPKIRFAADPDFHPIESNQKGTGHAGFSADLLHLFKKKFALNFEFVPTKSWKEAEEKARNREIDMWSAVASNEKRQTYMLFTKPYLELPAVIVARKEAGNSLTMKKLKGMRVAVRKDYEVHYFVQNNHPQMDLNLVPDILTGLRKVSLGLVDAKVVNIAAARHFIKEEKLENIHVAGKSGFALKLALASRNDWPILNEILKKCLANITPQEMQAIMDKWVPVETETFISVKDLGKTVVLFLVVFLVTTISIWIFSLQKLVRLRTSEFKAAKEEAEKANKAKSQFLNSMSHELRTPMNAIIGFANLLKRNKEKTLSERQQGNVGEILTAGSHLLELINELLDLARIESGKIKISMENVDLSKVIDEVLPISRPLAEQRGISITSDIPEGSDIKVWADSIRLKQALFNLVSNAIKYNEENGSVTLIVQKAEPDRIKIGVTDTGAGIPEEKQKLVFEPFDRLDADGTMTEGTGIGLAITKQLVELMGGSVTLESTLGKGSTFSIELNTPESE